jgi:ribosomal protein S18 acetylase RimI-like enzyme
LIDALAEADIPLIAPFAQAIWRGHYSEIISSAQIDYMLRGRYTAADLLPYLGAVDRWFELLRVEGALAGFLRTRIVAAPTLEIVEIYLDAAWRGRGFGQLLLAHAEARAVGFGCAQASLAVNKHNAVAIRAYERFGFSVREAIVVDIGGGFVMDDYVMAKALRTSP